MLVHVNEAGVGEQRFGIAVHPGEVGTEKERRSCDAPQGQHRPLLVFGQPGGSGGALAWSGFQLADRQGTRIGPASWSSVLRPACCLGELPFYCLRSLAAV